MKIRRAVLIAMTILVIGLASWIVLPFCLIGGAYFMCDLQPYTEIAKIDASNERLITIYADSCWEINRGIYYEAHEAGNVVIPRTFVDWFNGTEEFTFKIAYANDRSLVEIYDPAVYYNRDLSIIINFEDHESWPAGQWNDKKSIESKKRAILFFEQLRQENPGLPRPGNLTP